jgi:hypothetical protein
MGIDTAFLVGVLVGQWIMLFVLGRMISRMARLIMIFETYVNSQPSSKSQIIEIFSEGENDQQT